MSSQEPSDPTKRFAGFESLPLRVVVRVGQTRCRVKQLAELSVGEVLPLDRRIGEPFALCCGEVLLGDVDPVTLRGGVAVKLVRIAGEDEDHGA